MIIGVDFDNTLCVNGWPDISKGEQGFIHRIIMNYMIEQQRKGHEIVLVTMRENKPDKDDDYLMQAIMWCGQRGLIIKRANNNTAKMIDEYGPSRKVYCDRYLDDTNYGIIGWLLRMAKQKWTKKQA